MTTANTDKTATQNPAGLEDLIATESSICFIDGPNCRLVYRGYSVNDLAGKTTFEEIVYLMIYKKLPTVSELAGFNKKWVGMRALPEAILARLTTIPPKTHPMVVLRTLVSAFAFFDTRGDGTEANVERALETIARIPTLIAAWDRTRKGNQPIAPKTDLSLSENFLYMLNGNVPDKEFVRALDLYLVLLADHELNASTFALRVTASTLSDYYSGITSAIGALKGPLHGGANEQVIKMLLEIGDVSKVDAFLQKAIAEKHKIMGFGHRVYKVKDPRSLLLKDAAREVCKKTGHDKLFQMSEKIESKITSEKKLPSNVDFYSASLLYCLGIDSDLFTPLFVMSRSAGYSAHYLEQVADNRLIRPRAQYVGPNDLDFVPLSQR